jgi:TM2 domain-containing membrane protein YozV
MRSLLALITVLLLQSTQHRAWSQLSACGVIGEIILEQSDEGFIDIRENLRKSENPRLVAIGLDLALGLFGMHRLYLGTDVKVPVAYTLTFGGGGILWLVDLALLIGSPSIESYKNNPHLFMWIPPTKTAQ